jgi:XTP/dITP diphosphohydrolase
MKVVLATRNPGKLKELQDLAANDVGVELVLAPPSFDPAETGETFMENAEIKARAAALATGLHAVADDSGIEVDALGGGPGVHSARYCAGTDADRRAKLLEDFKATASTNRSAAFVCAMVFCSPTGEVLHTVQERWQGSLQDRESGANGFGYDPIFYVEEWKRSSAELTMQEKNQLSHRAKAWRAMSKYLQEFQQ